MHNHDDITVMSILYRAYYMIHKLWARFDHGLRDDQTLTGFYNL